MSYITKSSVCLLLLGSLFCSHASDTGRLRGSLEQAILHARSASPGDLSVIGAFRVVDRELDVGEVLEEARIRGGELALLEASLDLQLAISSRREELLDLAFNHEYDQIRSDAARLLEFALAEQALQRDLLHISATDKRFSRRLLAHRLLFERRLWNDEASELLRELASAADARQMQTILSLVSTWGIKSFCADYLNILNADWSEEEIERFRSAGIEGSVPYRLAAIAISHMDPDDGDLLSALEKRIQWFHKTLTFTKSAPAVLHDLDLAYKVARGVAPKRVRLAMDGTGPLDITTQYGPDWLPKKIDALKALRAAGHSMPGIAVPKKEIEDLDSIVNGGSRPRATHRKPGAVYMPQLITGIFVLIGAISCVVFVLKRVFTST